jgi:hypothetical protein
MKLCQNERQLNDLNRKYLSDIGILDQVQQTNAALRATVARNSEQMKQYEAIITQKDALIVEANTLIDECENTIAQHETTTIVRARIIALQEAITKGLEAKLALASKNIEEEKTVASVKEVVVLKDFVIAGLQARIALAEHNASE